MQHFESTEVILKCCFEVANELGIGFLESLYKNALAIALKSSGLLVCVEKRYEVVYRGEKIGLYVADLVVEDSVIVEVKCCKSLLPEHQAQLINYLKASECAVGLLVNFWSKKLEFRRLSHPESFVLSREKKLI